jgi:hypothetical protein
MRCVGSLRYVLFSLAAMAAAGCGNDKSGITGVGGTPSPNFVQLQSDPGDYIGGGQTTTIAKQTPSLA